METTGPVSRFERVPLGSICQKCFLDSPNIVVEPVCASNRQLWSVFWCVDCGAKGLVNVSVHHNRLEIYRWSGKVAATHLWLRMWGSLDG